MATVGGNADITFAKSGLLVIDSGKEDTILFCMTDKIGPNVGLDNKF